jgi:hypothetical protein
LEKERQHYLNALHALRANGDETATEGLEAELAEIERAIEHLDYRAASAGGSCGANLRRSPGGSQSRPVALASAGRAL